VSFITGMGAMFGTRSCYHLPKRLYCDYAIHHNFDIYYVRQVLMSGKLVCATNTDDSLLVSHVY